MKRGAQYLVSDTHKRARPQPMPSRKRSAAQLFHPSKRPCVPASTLKRSAAQLFHPPKRQCFHAAPPPPDMNAVFAQLVQYVASLEQRIATLESMVRAPGPAEPFARQQGIVVF
tara:strand:- start:247 stop:588 length:342 start_codon:yes stop_codon:yes gene_type:complete